MGIVMHFSSPTIPISQLSLATLVITTALSGSPVMLVFPPNTDLLFCVTVAVIASELLSTHSASRRTRGGGH